VRRDVVRAVVTVAACLALLVLVVRFVAEPFAIASDSMAPTLPAGSHVLVSKLSYGEDLPAPGDIVAYETDDGAVAVKRVAGTAGDTVEIADGVLVRNRRLQREPYVDIALVDGSFFGPVTVPPDHVFVLGDDRFDSDDSRFHGAVAREAVLGRVVARLWPPRWLAGS
jgi:signal peptidase I